MSAPKYYDTHEVCDYSIFSIIQAFIDGYISSQPDTFYKIKGHEILVLNHVIKHLRIDTKYFVKYAYNIIEDYNCTYTDEHMHFTYECDSEGKVISFKPHFEYYEDYY